MLNVFNPVNNSNTSIINLFNFLVLFLSPITIKPSIIKPNTPKVTKFVISLKYSLLGSLTMI